MKISRKKVKVFITMVLIIVAFRVALPYVMLYFINKKLANVKGYYGYIEDIDVALYRGSFIFYNSYLNSVNKKSKKQTPFIKTKKVDISLEWSALWARRIVAKAIVDMPILIFTEDKVELDVISEDSSDFRVLVRDLIPIDINTLTIRNGQLKYIDRTREPNIDVAITDLDGVANNLRNVYHKSELLPATINATGSVYQGRMDIKMKLNPLAKIPTFDLNAKVEKMQLTGMNEVFMSYASFDVNKGTFSMYTEIAANSGQFAGYVKPLIIDMDVVSWKGQDKKDGFFQKVWESVVETASEVFKNQNKNQVATKISFSGDLDSPNINIFQAVVAVLQNAFVRSFKNTIDNQINVSKIKQVINEKKGFLDKLFNRNLHDDKNKKKVKNKNKVKNKAERKKKRTTKREKKN